MEESCLNTAIANAVNFLKQNQLPHGEFRSYIASNEAMKGRCTLESCTGVTSCVLYSLQFLDSPEIGAMKGAAANFLIEEMTPPGIWKYWSSKFSMTIDPDVDDTVLASVVLRDLCPDIREERNFDILLRNRNQDGLFLTWIRKAGDRNDVDSVVNANAVLYLGEKDETKVVCEYLNTVIAEHRESETYYYYLDDLALYHAVSRAYMNGVTSLGISRDAVISRIADSRRGDGSWGNELVTALALCSLHNFQCNDIGLFSRSVEYLLASQRSDGGWDRRAFSRGPEPPAPYSAWAGSEELTTAFCLEALARYQALAPREGPERKAREDTHSKQREEKQVNGEMRDRPYMNKRFARSDSIVSRSIAGECILVPIRQKGEDVDSIYALNEVASRVWELIDGERTMEEVGDHIVAEYDVAPEVAEQDMVELLMQLESVGAVKEV